MIECRGAEAGRAIPYNPLLSLRRLYGRSTSGLGWGGRHGGQTRQGGIDLAGASVIRLTVVNSH